MTRERRDGRLLNLGPEPSGWLRDAGLQGRADLEALGAVEAYRRVKRRSLVAGEEGPSLSGFERLERRASGLAVLLLLPALLLGGGVAQAHEPGRSFALLTLLTGALLVLLAVAGLIWWRRPLKGRLAALLNLVATGLLVVAVLLAHRGALGGAP